MTAPEPLAYEHTFPEGHLDLDAIKVVNRLERFGHVAYFVGGCLRDLLLGLRPKDYDLVTSATPRQVKKLFRNSRIIGRRFKLVHVVFGGKVIELSTFRGTSELDTDDALPAEKVDTPPTADDSNITDTTDDQEKSLLIKSDNDFGTAQEDAVRRDFTINALYYSQERKQIIDYVGGIEDLKARRLSTIGETETRFLEDPVRMIRAIKLMVKLRLNVDEEIIEKTREHHKELLNASSPRILEEMYKLLESRKSAEIFEKLYEFGILETILKPIHGKFKECYDGVKPLVETLAKLDMAVDDEHSPSKPLTLGSLLLPITENIFTSNKNKSDYSSDAAQATDEERELSESSEEQSEQPPAEEESPKESLEEAKNSFVKSTREDIAEFLHETHGLQAVSRRDREDTVRLLEQLPILLRANEDEIKSIMRKSSFPDTFRLFKIGVQATGKFEESLEKLEEFTKDYNFYPSPPPRYDHRRNNNRHRPRRNNNHSRGRSR